MITSEKRGEGKKRKPGDRIRYSYGNKEYHGIVMKVIGHRQIKSITKREVMAMAKEGIVPKIAIDAKSEIIEGERVTTRAGVYVVLHIVTEPGRRVLAKIVTIPCDKITYKSHHKLDTLWLIHAKARYRQHLKRLRDKRKEL